MRRVPFLCSFRLLSHSLVAFWRGRVVIPRCQTAALRRGMALPRCFRRYHAYRVRHLAGCGRTARVLVVVEGFAFQEQGRYRSRVCENRDFIDHTPENGEKGARVCRASCLLLARNKHGTRVEPLRNEAVDLEQLFAGIQSALILSVPLFKPAHKHLDIKVTIA